MFADLLSATELLIISCFCLGGLRALRRKILLANVKPLSLGDRQVEFQEDHPADHLADHQEDQRGGHQECRTGDHREGRREDHQ